MRKLLIIAIAIICFFTYNSAFANAGNFYLRSDIGYRIHSLKLKGMQKKSYKGLSGDIGFGYNRPKVRERAKMAK